MKKTIECMGGPAHGRKVKVDARSRFVEFPTFVDNGVGVLRYEIIGSLAFYI